MSHEIYRNWDRMNGILEIVAANPGVRYSRLTRMSGLAHGVLSHYLSRMERANMVRITRQSRRTFVFPAGIAEEFDHAIICLRRETTFKILAFLAERDAATFQEVREASGKSPSTASIALAHLVEAGLVRRVYVLDPKFELKDRALVLEAMGKLRPTAGEAARDRFADTFSFF